MVKTLDRKNILFILDTSEFMNLEELDHIMVTAEREFIQNNNCVDLPM